MQCPVGLDDDLAGVPASLAENQIYAARRIQILTWKMNDSAPIPSLPPPLHRQTGSVDGPRSRPQESPRQNSACQKKMLTGLLQNLRENKYALKAMLAAFRALQRVGLTVVPNHFYWPIPDLRELESRDWASNPSPAGLDLNLKKQLQLTQDVLLRYKDEWVFPDSATDSIHYHYNNGFFETVDAEVAYSLVRHFKPSNYRSRRRFQHPHPRRRIADQPRRGSSRR